MRTPPRIYRERACKRIRACTSARELKGTELKGIELKGLDSFSARKPIINPPPFPYNKSVPFSLSGGARELQNGRYRFYDEIKPSRNPGEMQGARLVREWDPSTGNKRTWYETIDHTGNVRSVAPKPVTHEKNHHIFDVNGNYNGKR